MRMPNINSTIKQYFGQDALAWVDRSYISDWTIVGLLWLLSYAVSASPVYERDFSIDDRDIDSRHKKDQVASWLNNALALFVPLVIFIVVGCVKRSLLMIHHGAIGLVSSRGLARLVTEFFKHRIGRLRPDFLARCRWDDVAKECTGNIHKILDGRKSFPSGHSSTAFSGMFFLSLWIAGQTAAWCFVVPKSPRSLISGRMPAFVLTLLPIIWATHVAVTRIQDNRHHKEDVIVGSLLGCICALMNYVLFWPNPFSRLSFEPHVYGEPRLLYNDEAAYRSRASDFELSRLEADDIGAT